MAFDTIELVGDETKAVEKGYPPLERGYYLVKPLYVVIDNTLNALVNGYIPFKPPIIPGSTGLVRILEPGYGARPDLSGLLAIISPISKKGILGIEINGLLAKHVAIPEDTIALIVEKKHPMYSIGYYVAVANKVAELSKDQRLLIIGAGLTGFLAAILSRESSLETDVFTLSRPRIHLLKKIGINNVGPTPIFKGPYDVIFYNFQTSIYLDKFLNLLRRNGILVINPFIRNIMITLETRLFEKVEIIHAHPTRSHYHGFEKIWNVLKRELRIINVDSFSAIENIRPYNMLGLIISL